MRKFFRLLFFIAFVIVFSCSKDYNNPYDRECPPEIWTPTNLKASNGTNGIDLIWEQKATHFDGFMLERSLDSTIWTTVNSVIIDKTKRDFTDSEKLSGTKVFYRISGKADKNQSGYSYSKGIILIPAAPGPINGPVLVQQNANGIVYSISPVTGATSYNWLVPNGVTIVSGQGTVSITVNFGPSGGTIAVRAQNGAGNSPYTNLDVAVCLTPPIPGTITGPASVQINAAGINYSIVTVTGATKYNWTVPEGATIVSGQGTTGITVNFGMTFGNISVRAENICGNSAYSDLTITVCQLPSKPGIITGPTSLQYNASGIKYSITPVSGVTRYNWMVPNGATIVSGQGTSIILVNFGTTGGEVSVRAENNCGYSDYSRILVAICPLPPVPQAIIGPIAVLPLSKGVAYSISPVNGATGYTWTVPFNATIVSGQGTTSIIVDYGSAGGNISVRSENNCGFSEYAKLSVSMCQIPSSPVAIYGKSSVIFNAHDEVYYVEPNSQATSYNWKVPPGATIVSGQGTPSIVVNFQTQGGKISVRSENSCGNSPYFEMNICVFGSFNDSRDGKSYRISQIGTQIWMTENLAYLPSVNPPTDESNVSPMYYIFDYFGTSVIEAKATEYFKEYGVLYNWPAAMAGASSTNKNPSGIKGICPTGWHLPSDDEWTTLVSYLAGEAEAGGKMKEPGNNHWFNPNVRATNESCFTAIPSGSRSNSKNFMHFGEYVWYLSTTEISSSNIWTREVTGPNPDVFRFNSTKSEGLTVRCVKD
jgi:uncharacterized protein (TIGR02145 family)